MKCNRNIIKLFAVLMIGLFLIGFGMNGVNDAVDPKKAHFSPPCESLKYQMGLLDFRDCTPSNKEETSSPVDRIFQLIFILFFISPPLIVILLFLIWCELRKRNDNK